MDAMNITKRTFGFGEKPSIDHDHFVLPARPLVLRQLSSDNLQMMEAMEGPISLGRHSHLHEPLSFRSLLKFLVKRRGTAKVTSPPAMARPNCGRGEPGGAGLPPNTRPAAPSRRESQAATTPIPAFKLSASFALAQVRGPRAGPDSRLWGNHDDLM